MLTPRCVSLAIALSILVSASASAQYNRTAVSINGNDANQCTVASPCRSFDRAIQQTNSGGEVIALDSGGYGPFTVNKSVSVQAAPGVYAGITVVPSGMGITVGAAATDHVEIRGLTIRGVNVSGLAYGIYFTSGASLHIDDCVIGKFYGHGIFADLVTSGAMYVDNTLVRGTDIGIFWRTGTGTARGSAQNTRVENVSNAAFYVAENGRVTVSNSVASGSGVGYRITLLSGTAGELNIYQSIASNNGTGLLLDDSSGGTSTMRVALSMITNNTTGIFMGGAGGKNSYSYGNNFMGGNTTPGTFSGIIGQN